MTPGFYNVLLNKTGKVMHLCSSPFTVILLNKIQLNLFHSEVNKINHLTCVYLNLCSLMDSVFC